VPSGSPKILPSFILILPAIIVATGVPLNSTPLKGDQPHLLSIFSFLIGKFNYALIVTNISTLFMTISVWFWNDINDELKEYDFSYYLATTTKVWRWSITFISLNFLIQSLQNLSCFSLINSSACQIWLQPSSNLYIIIKNLFNFFLGANFTQPISKFLGLFSLLIYILGLIQWSIIKLPKNGRNSCFSENGKN